VYDAKCDVFSLGVVLFEMFHEMGTEMERARTLQALRDGTARNSRPAVVRRSLTAHRAEAGRFPGGFEEKYPVPARLISCLLRTDPTLRPSTAQLLSMIKHVISPCVATALRTPSASPISQGAGVPVERCAVCYPDPCSCFRMVPASAPTASAGTGSAEAAPCAPCEPVPYVPCVPCEQPHADKPSLADLTRLELERKVAEQERELAELRAALAAQRAASVGPK
jgi:hypothetical protein